jgi:hypothetical protein
MRYYKIFPFIFCFVIITTCGNAQSIKNQAEQKKQQQQYEQEQKQRQLEIEREQKENELKEQNRILKAQLTVDQLIELLNSNDFGYVDKFLVKVGWSLEKTEKKQSESVNNIIEVLESTTWSFDKNRYNNLAQSWLTYYSSETYGNIVSYRIANEELFNKIENSILFKGFKKVDNTKTVDYGLQTRYRDAQYEFILTKLKKTNSEEGADIRYDITIFNFKKVDQILQEQAEAERREKEKAEKILKEKQLAEQKAREEERRIAEEKRLKEEQFGNAILNGDNALDNRNYDLALDYYQSALVIDPEKTVEVDRKIQNINTIKRFLIERKTTIYDYKEINNSEYEKIDNSIFLQIKQILENREDFEYQSISIVYNIDTLGKISCKIPSSLFDKNFRKEIENMNIPQSTKYGYNVMAKATFNYKYDKYHSVIKVKNKPDGYFSRHEDFITYRSFIKSKIGRDAPIGKYTFDFKKTTINGKVFEVNQLIKVKSYGPEYVFLSMIVPGLGRHYVNMGEKNNPSTMTLIGTSFIYTAGLGLLAFPFADKTGISTGIYTYGFAGASLYFYLTKKDISILDSRFDNKDVVKTFGIIAGVYYVHELIYVLAKGASNSKKIKKWKNNNNFGLFYDPQSKGYGLTYALRF